MRARWRSSSQAHTLRSSLTRAADFVHQTAISSTGFRFLKEGERVRGGGDRHGRGGSDVRPTQLALRTSARVQVAFDLSETDRGVQATNVTGPDGEPLDRAPSSASPHNDAF